MIKLTLRRTMGNTSEFIAKEISLSGGVEKSFDWIGVNHTFSGMIGKCHLTFESDSGGLLTAKASDSAVGGPFTVIASSVSKIVFVRKKDGSLKTSGHPHIRGRIMYITEEPRIGSLLFIDDGVGLADNRPEPPSQRLSLAPVKIVPAEQEDNIGKIVITDAAPLK